MFLFELLPDHDQLLCGKVRTSDPIRYEVFGPFGSGYNIRVTGASGSGSLRFTRDYAGSAVKTPTGKCDMSAEGAYSANGKKVIELVGESVITESTDLL